MSMLDKKSIAGTAIARRVRVLSRGSSDAARPSALSVDSGLLGCDGVKRALDGGS
ncbi:MAG: hypothetical protein KJN97_04290 [Deltaproteobacteria bacterium]|nr:hypothetical protein [Deltaproteobacteria bacterium]